MNPSEKQLLFFFLHWLIPALFEILGFLTPTKTCINFSYFCNDFIKFFLYSLMSWFNSRLVLLYPSCNVVRGSLKMSKSGRKYVSKSAQIFFLFQTLLYLAFISGISLAFRIIELTTEFSSMIQSPKLWTRCKCTRQWSYSLCLHSCVLLCIC